MDLTSIIATIGLILLAGGILYVLYRLRQREDLRIGARAFVLIISGLFAIISFWLVVGANIQPARVGWVFFGANLFTFVYTAIEPQVAAIFKQRVATSQAVVTARNLFVGSMTGIVVGIVFIVLSGYTGFTIGVPSVSYSFAGEGVLQFLTTAVVAPFTEEPLFLIVIPSFLTLVFMTFFGNKILSLTLSLVVSSVIFSMFHWYAYGANLSLAIGAFTGAFLFRLFMLIIDLVKEGEFSVNAGAKVLSITIPTHIVFNTYVYTAPLFIAGQPLSMAGG